MAIDPIAAALEAIAAHFDGLTDGTHTLRARRGWPERPEDLDLSQGPVLTVTPGPVVGERCSPRTVDQEDAGGGDLLVTYRVGYLDIRAQLDLWAPYRARRDDFAALVEAAAVNNLPHASDLRLTSTGYHDRPLTVALGAGVSEDEGATVERGEWRQRWELAVATDLVAQATHPKLVANAFQVVTTHHGITVTEPTHTETP